MCLISRMFRYFPGQQKGFEFENDFLLKTTFLCQAAFLWTAGVLIKFGCLQ